MEALNNSTDSEPSSIGTAARLFDELAGTLRGLSCSRRREALRILMAKDISDSLKRAIRSDERSSYRLALDAGVRQQVIDRFLSGERDIRLATAAKLAKALGLELSAARTEPNR